MVDRAAAPACRIAPPRSNAIAKPDGVFTCSSVPSSHCSPPSEATSRGTSGSSWINGPERHRRRVDRCDLSAPLIALGIGGANKLLPATFLVIVGTVTIYGLGAPPLVRALGLGGGEPETTPTAEPPSVTSQSDQSDAPSAAQRGKATTD
jgi:hypothetical protein